MHDDHTRRRLELARWYTREAIASDAAGDYERSAEELLCAREYLTALMGSCHVMTADDAMALICQIEDGSVAVTS